MWTKYPPNWNNLFGKNVRCCLGLYIWVQILPPRSNLGPNLGPGVKMGPHFPRGQTVATWPCLFGSVAWTGGWNPPRNGLSFSPKCSKMFFGHNLHHMQPFGILEAGFCMVFRCASFWFWVPRTHFWTPEPTFGSRIWNWAPAGPGRFGEGKWGLGKYGFVELWTRK